MAIAAIRKRRHVVDVTATFVAGGSHGVYQLGCHSHVNKLGTFSPAGRAV